MAADSPENLEGHEEHAEADLREYSQTLGIDFDSEVELHWVVQEAFNAPLPASWTEHTDAEDRVYFFHEATNQSTWEHPMDNVYRELLGCIHDVTSRAHPLAEEERLSFIQDHLRQVHQRALEKLEGWSGPYTSDAGEYYYNEALKVSTWESPLMEWEQELTIRHSVLCRCLLPDYATMSSSDGNAVHGGASVGGPDDLLRSLQLPLGLIRREDNGEEKPATPSARSFHTARSACSTRSQMSGRGLIAPSASIRSSRSPMSRSPRLGDDGENEFTFGSTNKVQLPKFAAPA
jgi:hypothetical protein